MNTPNNKNVRSRPRRAQSRGMVVQRPLRSTAPFREKMNVSITYADVFQLASAGGFALRTFRLNSIFDPDLTGVGGQPTYYTQLAAIYSEYVVNSVDVEIFYVNSAVAGVFAGHVWGTTNDTPVATATQAQQLFLEGRKSKFAWLAAENNPGFRSTLRSHIDIAANNGVSRLDDDYGSMFGANPFNVNHLDVIGVNPATAAVQVTVDFTIRITFHVTVHGLLGSFYQD